jgi:pilus assembly protein Flp/PilA
MFKMLWRDEEGLTTVEYAMLLALVAIAAIAAWTTLGNRVSTTASTAANSLPGATPHEHHHD